MFATQMDFWRNRRDFDTKNENLKLYVVIVGRREVIVVLRNIDNWAK